MSFIVTVFTHEGIVMAADSRLTLNAKVGADPNVKDIAFEFSNSTRKLFRTPKGIGISTCGDAGIGSTPIAGHIEQFAASCADNNVEGIAQSLLEHFRKLSPTLNTIFHVGGYEVDGKQKLLRVFTSLNTVLPVDVENQGAVWNGEMDVLARLFTPSWQANADGKPGDQHPSYIIPWQFFSLQDAIDFALFAMTTTIGAIRFQNRLKTVGGPIDLLAIKPDGVTWVQRKELHGETV